MPVQPRPCTVREVAVQLILQAARRPEIIYRGGRQRFIAARKKIGCDALFLLALHEDETTVEMVRNFQASPLLDPVRTAARNRLINQAGACEVYCPPEYADLIIDTIERAQRKCAHRLDELIEYIHHPTRGMALAA